ncbi:MAG: GNAT family N-acetyltransferase [Candidatus Woesearchaeota archaeon]
MAKIYEGSESDLHDLAAVYMQQDRPHNIFSKSTDYVLDYLSRLEVRYLVVSEQDKVVGGVAVIVKEETSRHNLTRLKHFAVLTKFRNSVIPQKLLEAAEKMAAKGKIEIHVSETETADIEFFMAQGYAIEGELSNHYRHGEKCYVLGKKV